jgi:hypothetical protein
MPVPYFVSSITLILIKGVKVGSTPISCYGQMTIWGSSAIGRKVQKSTERVKDFI